MALSSVAGDLVVRVADGGAQVEDDGATAATSARAIGARARGNRSIALSARSVTLRVSDGVSSANAVFRSKRPSAIDPR